jgi:tetratricopeptide (TPR) repeat protein
MPVPNRIRNYSQNTKETFEKSIGYYEQAIEKDPNYALAYAALANTYIDMATRGFSTSKEAGQKGERAALRALELDDTLAEAHAWLGMSKYANYEWAEAEKAIKRALELDPNSYFANLAYFQYLSTVGRPDEALSYAIRAQELDPAFMPGRLAMLTSLRAATTRQLICSGRCSRRGRIMFRRSSYSGRLM